MRSEAASESWPFPGVTSHGRTFERPAYFGFVINGNAGLGSLAELYGLKVPDARRVRTFADFVARALADRPRVGDRVALGAVELTVLEVNGRAVDKIGLRFGRKPGAPATPPRAAARN